MSTYLYPLSQSNLTRFFEGIFYRIMQYMLIEISIGEGLDRLSILEIKSTEIISPEKLRQVYTEIESLRELQSYKTTYLYYYKLIHCVNKQIWDLTNSIKQMQSHDSAFAETAHQIFELNQSRFRVKNILNQLTDSNIKEQKSYGATQISIFISNNLEKDIIHKHLAYLSISYDVVNIVTDSVTKSYIEGHIPMFNYVFNDCLVTDIDILSVAVPAFLIV
jgi:hypothetical protein